MRAKLFPTALAVGAFLFSVAFAACAETATVKVGVKNAMTAQLVLPDRPGPHPAILLLHTSGGLQAGDLQFAQRLAHEGYAVLVPAFLDAYQITAKTRQATFTTYAADIYADFVASLESLGQNKEIDGKRVATIGFSNGAYFALWLAASGKVQAGVSYYGALTGAGTDRSLARFHEAFDQKSAPVLILHGTDDATVPFAKAAELDALLSAAQARHEFQSYPGAGHRFDREGGPANEAAAADVWPRTLKFLSEALN
jgi:carboxymethylenebutenolidase